MNLRTLSTARQARHLFFLFFALATAVTPVRAQLATRNFAVELSATLAGSPPEITLHWTGDQYARSYKINRKKLFEKDWTQIGTAEGPATKFIDRQIAVGQGYEYQVVREGSLAYTGYGYIYAGIAMPLVEQRGRIILAIEESVAQALPAELKRFEFDLVGDGWQVARLNVSRNEKPPDIKARIRALYNAAPQETVALLLFGNVPVPYAGNITPDEHDNHRGAWPADVYYGDINGAWTDEVVNNKEAERTRNHNVPGDGKFDQSEIPTSVELRVGRVDLSNMTCYLNKTPSQSEVDLLRRYLDKNHRFRHTQIVPQQRAMIFDRIGVRQPEALAATAWRNFAPFVGKNIQAIKEGEYFPNAMNGSYLWSAVAAGGSYSYADSVGSADAFALHPVNVVFATFVGSYYGDWDVESNFLRASLGARGSLLAATYGGKPQWLFHPMALGEPIGTAVKITQENGQTRAYPPFAPGTGEVHISLLGDPTLRAHPIEPVKNLRGSVQGGSLNLSWDASTAAGLAGYFVYRASSSGGPYQRVTPNIVTATSASVSDYRASDSYMVRAIALTQSPSGSYYNASQGLFFPDPLGAALAELPVAPANLTIGKVSASSISITWVGNAVNTTGYIVERKAPGEPNFVEFARVGRDAESYLDNSLPRPGTYEYRAVAENDAGRSAYSNIAAANNQPASASFVGLDRMTKGNWIGTYGREGHVIPALEERMPPYSSLTLSNVLLYRPSLDEDVRGPQLTTRTDGLRSANCWLHNSPFTLQLSFADDSTRRVALYTTAWAKKDPSFKIQVYDAVGGTLLDERTVGDINEGVYLIYTVRRQVHFRIVPPPGHLIEIYGLFIDLQSVAPVQIDPAGGTINGKALVNLSTPTEGASIYYTLDGTTPTQNARRYTEPFWMIGSGFVRARAFLDGVESSSIAEARFTDQSVNNVGFLRWDDQSSGSWVGRYGRDGFLLPGILGKKPGYLDFSIEGQSEWTWNETTTDPRALFTDTTGTRRRAAGWYTGNTITVNLGIFDAKSHSVAFYFVDWDRLGREQRVEVIDANSRVIESHLLKDFASGRYLVISVQGAAKIQITRLRAGNAVLNGIFFDPSPDEISDPVPLVLSAGRMADGFFSARIGGAPGANYCLDRSDNLLHWTCIGTNLLRTEVGSILEKANGEPSRFFRTHYVP